MKCEICGKEFDENLGTCPNCNSVNPQNAETSTGSQLSNVEDTQPESKTTEEIQEPIIIAQESITTVEPTQNQAPTSEPISTQKSFCKYCGNEIKSGTTYCPVCGRSSVDESIRHCPKCGLVLDKNQKFCTSCGEKIKYNKVVAKADHAVKSNKKSIKIAVILILVVAIVGGSCAIALPKIFASPYTIMETADYEKAYKHANDSEKVDVLFENVIAKACSDIKENLKSSKSFELNNVWITETEDAFVIESGGANSYGAIISSYYYYKYDEDQLKYVLWIEVNDFKEETIYKSDSADEKIDKKLNNLYKPIIKAIVSNDSLKVKNGMVERINALSQNDTLKDIELIDQITDIYPSINSNDA